MASVICAFGHPDDIPSIVKLNGRNRKSGEDRVCLTVQLHTFVRVRVEVFFSRVVLYSDIRGDLVAFGSATVHDFMGLLLAKSLCVRMQL